MTSKAAAFKMAFPAIGEDIKVMGVREGDNISLTVSCAFVGRIVANIAAYSAATEALQVSAVDAARGVVVGDVVVRVNTADDLASGSVFLTVSGTSAEEGDDGQTGRGNRANGLMTPCRPMTLEALAGKNPVTHVGKLYNAAASKLAAAIVAEVPSITEAECFLVSQIAAPVDRPRIALLRVWCRGGVLTTDAESRIRAVAEREIGAIPSLWRSFLMETNSVA